MQIKTADLEGLALDWAVAKCEGWKYDDRKKIKEFQMQQLSSAKHSYSTVWAKGGPLIEREKIAVAYEPSMVYDDSCRWKALAAMSDNEHQYGPTPLIAAMRCYVASRLGDEADVPEEFTPRHS